MNSLTDFIQKERFIERIRYVLCITGIVLITSGIVIGKIGFFMFGAITEGDITKLPEQTQSFITLWNLFMYAVPLTLIGIGLSAIFIPILAACIQDIIKGLKKLFRLLPQNRGVNE